MKNKILALIMVVLIIIIAIAGITLYKQNNSTQTDHLYTSETDSDIMNDIIIVEDDTSVTEMEDDIEDAGKDTTDDETSNTNTSDTNTSNMDTSDSKDSDKEDLSDEEDNSSDEVDSSNQENTGNKDTNNDKDASSDKNNSNSGSGNDDTTSNNGNTSNSGSADNTDYDPADTNKDGVVDGEEAAANINQYEQMVIEAGYGVVVEIDTNVYAVLTHGDGYVNGKDGSTILREYLASMDLEPQNVSGGWINSDNDWYWYIAKNIRELITPDDEEFWD